MKPKCWDAYVWASLARLDAAYLHKYLRLQSHVSFSEAILAGIERLILWITISVYDVYYQRLCLPHFRGFLLGVPTDVWALSNQILDCFCQSSVSSSSSSAATTLRISDAKKCVRRYGCAVCTPWAVWLRWVSVASHCETLRCTDFYSKFTH